MDGPNLILLAGPNGAGKTTASNDLLAGAFDVQHFINADDIALDLGGKHAAIAAGRIMLKRLRHLTDQRANDEALWAKIKSEVDRGVDAID
jgi:predicted ABC-type ATPase